MYSSSPGGGGRKRGRDDYDDGGNSSWKQRRFDIDQALPDRPYRGGGGGFRRGGGGPRRSHGYGGNNRDYRDSRDVIPLLSVGEKYCVDLWRFGDERPESSTEETSRFISTSIDDINGLKNETADVWSKGSRDEVLRGFRIATAECPHKLPWLAVVLGLLANEYSTPRIPAKPLVTLTNTAFSQPEHANGNGDAEMAPATPATPASAITNNIGLDIVKDLVKAFQNHLDARRWRSVRFTLQLFAHLASLPRPLITANSLLELLQLSFLNALENEPGLRAERGDELVRVILETLLRLDMTAINGPPLQSIKTGLANYLAGRKLDVEYLGGDSGNSGQWTDPIQELFNTVFGNPGQPAALPLPHQAFPSLSASSEEMLDQTFEPLTLPMISLPPETEAEENGVMKPATSGRATTDEQDFARDQVGYSGIRLTLGLFSDNSVPNQASKDGILLRTLVADILSVYEINRKECARIVLQDLPKWLPGGLFKSSNAADSEATSAYIFENLVMEVILSALFATPSAPHKPVYYYSLIGELCKISPQTVAPALGKCIRRLYAGLGEEPGAMQEEAAESRIILGPEGIKRFADWFAVHLSNFGFHWRWPEWEADLALPQCHPKKVFIARVLDLEIRLSYFDRIKLTIPEAYLSPSAGVYPAEAPAPQYTYEPDGQSLYQAPAAEVLRLMRSRATAEEIKEALEGYKKEFVEGEIGDPVNEEDADKVAKDIVFQALLNVGSRSFSHFLNVLERYITMLRESTNSAASRLLLLQSVSRFWAQNSQFFLIVVDKLLQYRVVDPVDVVAWVFTGDQASVLDSEAVPRNWSDMTTWDALRLTLEKVQTRVFGATARLQSIKKREENRIDTERAAASVAVAAEEDGTTGTDGVSGIQTDQVKLELETVEKQLANIKREQEGLLVEVVRRFQEAFANLETLEQQDRWQAWFFRGFFAEFCRAFAKNLYEYLEAVAMVELPSDSPVYQGLQAAHVWIEFA